MKKRLVLLMALSLTFAFPAAVMAEDTTAAEETADDTEAADSTAEDADVKSEGVMTHDEYLAAAVDDEVTIETYVQAKQSWWEDKATFYTQDKDGAYFIYNMPCSEEDYDGNDVAYLYNYDGSGSEGDDLYFNVSLNGETYTFTVESYLCDKDSDVYKAVEALNIGDKIDMEGFLYWYEGVNPHITSVTAAE